MKQSQAIVFALCCAALSATAAVAQPVHIPVHDLVRPPVEFPFPEEEDERNQRPWVSRLQGGNDLESRRLLGEAQLRRQQVTAGLFDLGGLTELVEQLARVEGGVQSVDAAAMLRVDAGVSTRVKEVLSWLRQNVLASVEVDLRLVRAAPDGARTVLLSAREQVVPGVVLRLLDSATRSAVVGYEVEIAQASAIANPIVREVAHGAALALRVRPTFDRAAVVVELVVRDGAARPASPIETRHEAFGRIDRLAGAYSDAGVVCRLERGVPATLSWRSADGGVLELTLSLRWPDAEARRPDAALFATPLLNRGLLHFSSTLLRRYEDIDHEPDGRIRGLVDVVLEGAPDVGILREEQDEAASGYAVLTGARASVVEAELVSALADQLPGSRLSVVLLDVPRGLTLEADVSETESPEGVRVLAHARGPVLHGSSVTFSGELESTYIADWNCEVAQASRIPAPQIAVARSGYVINARIGPGHGPGRGQAETVTLGVELATPFELEVRPVAMSVAAVAPEIVGGSGGAQAPVSVWRSDAVRLPADTTVIEVVHQRHHAFTTHLDVAQTGTAVVRRAAPALLGPDRELVVVVRVE